jgi:hypothetical protein
MEEKIISKLDNLSIEQTERLIDDTMEMKLSGRELSRIKNAVYRKIGSEKKAIYIPRKLIASAAAFAIVFASLFAIGFDNVYAAISRLFTFVPGVGIEQKIDASIYTADPVVGQVKTQGATANLVSAVYSNDYLTTTVEVLGKALYHDDFTFYLKQEPMINNNEEAPYSLSVSSDSTMLSATHRTGSPAGDDVFEIEIAGFAERLSFKMTQCRDYEDIAQIGPTDVQNGISITTATQRIGGQLVVWTYPYKLSGAVEDAIVGYGKPANGAFIKTGYIATESGQTVESNSGWQMTGRAVYDMPENDQAATLHIPYLSMLREESKKLNIKLPKGYTVEAADVSVKCSLGTIRVTEIERSPSVFDNDKDTIMVKFEFESVDGNMRLYSFDYQFKDENSSSTRHFDGEKGCLEYLEVDVGRSTSRLSYDISQLYYYLIGEYIIPLDIH